MARWGKSWEEDGAVLKELKGQIPPDGLGGHGEVQEGDEGIQVISGISPQESCPQEEIRGPEADWGTR